MATLRHGVASSSIIEGICSLGASLARRGHYGGIGREFTKGAPRGKGRARVGLLVVVSELPNVLVGAREE